MANRRSVNWPNQVRVNTSDIRQIESAVRNDFDDLISSFVAQPGSSHVVRGYRIPFTSAVGSSATGLQLEVANASLFHGGSDFAGTFLVLPESEPNQTLNSTTNPKVDGAFTPNTLNYIGIEFDRKIDDDTASQRYFWNPTTNVEFTQFVPLAEVLDYRIVITSSVWDSNVMPIALVETDASNNVVRVDDRRDMLFRLGKGGTATPDPFYVYPWNNDAEGREENFWSSSTNGQSPFVGGDKQIETQKEWMDAIMSELLQIKGTTFWYQPNAGGSLVNIRYDLGNTVMTGSGQIVHDGSNPGRLNWTSDINLTVVGSRIKYSLLENSTGGNLTLQDNQVAYIEIGRDIDIIPQLIYIQGSPTVESVGGVSWTSDVQAGDYIKVASEDVSKYYEIQSVDSVSQVTLTENFLETSTGPQGTDSQYAIGSYEAVASPSTQRHIKIVDRENVPFGEDIYWFFLRSDNGGAKAQIFVRSKGTEIEEGESIEIADNTSEEILTFIGSDGENDSTPNYTSTEIVSQGSSLVASTSALDAALKTEIDKSNQDRTSKLVKGGTWSWDLATNTLKLSQNAFVQVGGLAETVNQIDAADVVLPQDGSVAYISLKRTAGASSRTVSVDLIQNLTLTDDILVIARRVGDDVLVGRSFLLKDKEFLELDGALAEINRYFGQLKIIPHESNAKRVRITGSDVDLLNQTKLVQSLQNLLLSFEGAVIDFTTGNVFESDGSTPLGLSFTPASLGANEYFWYSFTIVPNEVNADNSITAQVLVLPASGGNTDINLAPKAPFGTGIQLGQVRVQESAGTIADIGYTDILRLGTVGGSGGGSGDANELLERFKNALEISRYKHGTAVIFDTDQEDFTDSGNTTATFSITDGGYVFESGNVLSSTNLVDPAIIESNVIDLPFAKLTAYWDFGAIDTGATYEVTRDGVNWQTITMNQLENSDTFNGEHEFTDEPTNAYTQTLGTPDGVSPLDTAQLSRAFTVSKVTVLKEVNTDITLVGTPVGSIFFKIVKDDGGGSPSTDLNDEFFISGPISVSTLSTGALETLLGTLVLPAGDYHVVVDGNDVYDAEYTSSGGANRIDFDSETGVGITGSIEGRQHDLRVRVTSSQADVTLLGVGIEYRKGTQVTYELDSLKTARFSFLSNTDNPTEFALPFKPHDRLLMLSVGDTGDNYKVSNVKDMRVTSNSLVVPENFFQRPTDTVIEVEIYQFIQSAVIDNSDDNSLLLAENNLGSQDPSLDKSQAGRGIFLRRPDGTLREITINDDDNIEIYSV